MRQALGIRAVRRGRHTYIDRVQGVPSKRLLELVLVRHGESEGNIAHNRSMKGSARVSGAQWRPYNRDAWMKMLRDSYGEAEAFILVPR